MNWRDRLRDAVNRSGKKHSVIAYEAALLAQLCPASSPECIAILASIRSFASPTLPGRTSDGFSMSRDSSSPVSKGRKCGRSPES